MSVTPDETTVTVGQINANISRELGKAVDGTIVHVTNRGREHVSVISTEQLRHLQYATAALSGFLRLAARGADCWEYAERAEDLAELVRCGALRLPPDVEQEVRQAPIPA